MKIIFLDIDGVLSSIDYMAEGIHIHPDKIKHVTRIVKETDAKIVISSTWRFNHGVKEFNEWFYRLGLRGYNTIIGMTPDLPGIRGAEIETWIKNNDPRHEIESYVIIDDDSDFLDYQLPYHVKTQTHYGITIMEADKAIDILGKDKNK
ncbi:MAG: hypothetical protein KAS32_23850 [Candidatus Peribacteraceae bacterium]|nr:hypothetical protein [Candidatus Peribacteraceae bacterium]